MKRIIIEWGIHPTIKGMESSRLYTEGDPSIWECLGILDYQVRLARARLLSQQGKIDKAYKRKQEVKDEAKPASD
jgi:hypothetical protein